MVTKAQGKEVNQRRAIYIFYRYIHLDMYTHINKYIYMHMYKLLAYIICLFFIKRTQTEFHLLHLIFHIYMRESVCVCDWVFCLSEEYRNIYVFNRPEVK